MIYSTMMWLAAAISLAFCVAIYLVRREGFDVGALFGKEVSKAKDLTGKVADKVTDKVADKPKYKPSYVGRQYNGMDWQCPDGTVDTGREDHEACIASQFHPQLWRWDGKQWGWSCPNGTTPTANDTWEMKCEVGYMQRVATDQGYACPWGTEDTGKSWENSSWHEAHKQCKRNKPYTLRVLAGGKWQCPPSSQDTGRGWSSSSNQWDQCKWMP